MSIFFSTSNTVSLFTILWVGSIADIVGKHRCMIIYPIVSFIQSSLYILLSSLHINYNPAWLMIPAVLPSLAASSQGSLLLCLAYMADVTTVKRRTVGMSRTEGFYYLSVGVAGILAGFLTKYVGFYAVFVLSACLSALSLPYVVLAIPDERALQKGDEEDDQLLPSRSLELEDSPKPSNLSSNCSKARESVLHVLSNFWRIFQSSNRLKILISAVLLFFGLFPFLGSNSIGSLYFSHAPFRWTRDKVGIFLGSTYFAQALGAWITVPVLQNFFHFGDLHMMCFGFFFTTVFFTVVGSVKSLWVLYVNQINLALGVIVLPVTRSVISKNVATDLHGSGLALAEVVDVLSSLASSFSTNFLYSLTVGIFPGIAAYLLAFTAFIGFLMTVSMLFICTRDLEPSP